MVLLKILIFWNKFSGHRRKFSWKPISTGGACFSWGNPSNLRPFYQGSSFALPPYQSRCKVGAKSVGKGRSIEFGTEDERRKGELLNAKMQSRKVFWKRKRMYLIYPKLIAQIMLLQLSEKSDKSVSLYLFLTTKCTEETKVSCFFRVFCVQKNFVSSRLCVWENIIFWKADEHRRGNYIESYQQA